MPDEPIPITATLLLVKSYVGSQWAEWTSLPSKSARPSISGHFQLLEVT